MSDDEYCELPLISIKSSACSSTFSMPSAEELASMRARETACSEELRRLRVADDADGAAPPPAAAEAALQAAVRALRAGGTGAPGVGAPGRPPPPHSATRLWAALLPSLPPLPPHPRRIAALLDETVSSVGAALMSEPGPWADEDILTTSAMLVVGALAHESRSRRAASRALHALLDERASDAQVAELARALPAALPAPRTRAELGDALRNGGRAGADRLADMLTCGAALDLLGAPAPRGEQASAARVAAAAGGWRGLRAERRYVCVQLAGRVLAAGGGGPAAGRRLLAALAPPPAAPATIGPDRLKVLSGASKLKLLFASKNTPTAALSTLDRLTTQITTMELEQRERQE